MLKIFYVGIGGFLGSIARYLIQTMVPHKAGIFPWGTFIVNIVGCLILGIIYGIAEKNELMTHEARLFFAIGFCGSFTTFSTFAVENLNLLQIGSYTNICIKYCCKCGFRTGSSLSGYFLHTSMKSIV